MSTLTNYDEACSRIQSEMVGFRLLYDRRRTLLSTVPEIVKPYVSGKKYLSTKQIASATLLRHSGSYSAKRMTETLLQSGFHFAVYEGDEPQTWDDIPVLSSASVETPEGSPAQISELASRLHLERAAESYSESQRQWESYDASLPSGLPSEKPGNRLEYDDPWLIIAGRQYAVWAGAPKESLPTITVWAGDGLRLQDPLPARLLGPGWESRNAIKFYDIADIGVKLHLLRTHTHWGKALYDMRYHSSTEKNRWARIFWRRIVALLSGGPDPSWKKHQVSAYWADPEYRSPRSRAIRLVEVLKTVDGMFQQRYFAFPEEYWTWEKFDMFVLGNLSHLIGDEFFDGSLTELSLERSTKYSELKKARKLFKEFSLKRKILEITGEEVPQWLRQLLPLWRKVAEFDGHEYAHACGILTQTRGCGTPPPLIVLQSKEKFLKTVSQTPEPFSETQKRLVKATIDKIISDLPDEAFTGLATKARITVSTAASWEKTRKEGGTIAHIHELVFDGKAGVPAPVRNLETGQVTHSLLVGEFESPGEYIFWRCLDFCLRTPLDVLQHAFLTVVKEPGKGRSVTKARSYLKVVLDVISKICAEPLKKGISSSTSGMGRSHHGWNFFQHFYDKGVEERVFDIENMTKTEYTGYEERMFVYKDIFLSSTDFEEATDAMKHEFATIASEGWMVKTGIPPVLRGLVHATCFRPRKIFFTAVGALKKYGIPEPKYGPDIRYITLRQGVLMGDPLTKIVLHLTNVSARTLSREMKDSLWLGTQFTNAHELARAGL